MTVPEILAAIDAMSPEELENLLDALVKRVEEMKLERSCTIRQQ